MGFDLSLSSLTSGFKMPNIAPLEMDINGVVINPSKLKDAVGGEIIDSNTGTELLGETTVESSSGKTDSTSLIFSIPHWGYGDFINERIEWTKGLNSATGDPGWFYFKIFFHFDTNFGLFGGQLGQSVNGETNKTLVTRKDNCASAWLKVWNSSYPLENLTSRARALSQFTRSLSYINSKAPWFFNKITGLDKAGFVDLNEPMKKRQLEIGCMPDAIDMRLTTLMELYKYACFDYVNFKEIIPENLRKFDMTVVVFNSPVRYIHTGVRNHKGKSVPYKGLDQVDNMMSYKMFSFYNCEFVGDSFGNYIPGEISNENPFQIGQNKLMIQYDKCYQHMSDENSGTMFGDDGYYTIDTSKSKQRAKMMQDAIDNFVYIPNSQNYKALIDETEDNVNDYMRGINSQIANANSAGGFFEGVWNQAKSSIGGMLSGGLFGLT